MDMTRQEIYLQLRQACSDGDLAFFTRLLGQTQEYKLDRKDRTFVQYMGRAARNGHVDIVMFLLDNSAEIDLEDTAYNAAEGAADSGNIESMKLIFDLLFRRGLDLINCEGILHTRSILECLPVLEYLLSKWANPNSISKDGYTVLAHTSNQASIQLLVAHGADFHSENLLHRALTLRSEYWEAHMKFLVNVLGVDINAPASPRRPGRRYPRPRRRGQQWFEQIGHAGTALHWAVRTLHCHREGDRRPRVRVLLEMGADVNALDDAGRTPMECATSQEMRDIITLYGKNGKEGEEREEVPQIIGSGE